MQGIAMSEEHYFYGEPICRRKQQEYIEQILRKYRGEPVNEELKKKIWDELQQAKHEKRITIPFKMAERKDPEGKFPPYIEVILDTKV